MSGELVRVRHNGVEFNTGRANAANKGFTVLDEPTHKPDGSPRRPTRVGGRKVKPKVSLPRAVEGSKSADSAEIEVAEVAAGEPAAGQLRPDNEE